MKNKEFKRPKLVFVCSNDKYMLTAFKRKNIKELEKYQKWYKKNYPGQVLYTNPVELH